MHGLLGASAIAVTADPNSTDDNYVLVTSAQTNSLAVFQIQTTAKPAAHILAGDLIFAQIVRENVGGNLGLDAPNTMALGPVDTGNSSETLWIGSTGSPSDQGGLVLMSLNLSHQAPPLVLTTKYENMTAIAVRLENGDNTVVEQGAPVEPVLGNETQAPYVATTGITTGNGDDSVTIDGYSGNTTVNLGSGQDTFSLQVPNATDMSGTSLLINGGTGRTGIPFGDTVTIVSTGAGANTTFTGSGTAIVGDTITIESTGRNSQTIIDGSDVDDTVRVVLQGLDPLSTTTLDGENPTVLPGDTLILDPQQDSISDITFAKPYTSVNVENGDSASISGFGTVSFSHFETPEILSGPSIVVDPSTVAEGGDLTITVLVTPNGTHDTVVGPVVFTLGAGGQIGSFDGTQVGGPDANGAYTYTVTIPWNQLIDLNVDSEGTYTVAVSATNGDGQSTTAIGQVTVNYTPPAVTLVGGREHRRRRDLHRQFLGAGSDAGAERAGMDRQLGRRHA